MEMTMASTRTESDPRWASVLARDARADDQFWYSVSTTGIYCRPSCRSRHADPKHVQLHATLDEARATGFRPCKRCHPDGVVVEEIRFAVGESTLGTILVATTGKGVVSVLLGNDVVELARDLQERFPTARLYKADRDERTFMARVVAFIEAPRNGFDLPLDLRGTAFQRMVWDALREIPAGQVLSYTDLAKRIGSPQAVRAVASACAANHLAVVVPCHRVVRRDGLLSGYAWGVQRKRALLDREAS
jgi:O-6-methylguanine DNA methyltransferase